MKKLTIGIPVYDDYDGVFFTLQALRFAYRLNDWIEFLVVDNNPDSIVWTSDPRTLREHSNPIYTLFRFRRYFRCQKHGI